MDNTPTPKFIQSAKPIEVFKPGKRRDANGKWHNFSVADCQELAASFNEAMRVPLTVGHPQIDAPAYGWVKAVTVDDKGLVKIHPRDVYADFAELVNNKMFPDVSASIFLRDHPNNPAPGKLCLNHIGFLGAAAPAVKGLARAEFASPSEQLAEFGYEDTSFIALFRRLRDWLIADKGMDVADQVLPQTEIDAAAQQVAWSNQDEAVENALASKPTSLDFSQHGANPAMKTPEQIAAEAALEQRNAELAAREAALAKREADAARADFAAFAETQITAGRLLPAQKEQVVAVMAQLHASNATADFSEGHVDHGKTGLDLFKQMIAAQPVQFALGRTTPVTQQKATADFAAPDGEAVSAEGLELMAKAREYQKAHPNMSLIDAAATLQRQGL